MFAATISDSHVEHRSGSPSDTFEVGLGNLKLIYSGKEGKLTQYINRKRKVYDLDDTLLIYDSFLFRAKHIKHC